MRVTFGNFDSARSYSLVAMQQRRAQLDSDINEAQEISSKKDPFSLGIAAMKDGFEFAKPENVLFHYLFERWPRN
jgi:hypothetical protein